MRLRWRMALVIVTFGPVLAEDSLPLTVAYIHPGDHGPVLTLFPMAGKQTTIPAPPGLSNNGRVVFGLDGNTVYVVGSGGVWRNDLKPARQSVVRGTSVFNAIWHFTISQDRIFVSGILKTQSGTECGTYEIAPDTESPRRLLAGVFPECGGGGGEVSPDGKRVLNLSGPDLALIDLETGAPQFVRGVKDLTREDVTWKGQAAWSPDGRWIAAFHGGSVTLIDLKTSRPRKVGRADGLIAWSPDSTKLLVSKSQLSCLPALYFESLAVIDLKTSKERIIESSHCNVSGGWAGWIDPEALK